MSRSDARPPSRSINGRSNARSASWSRHPCRNSIGTCTSNVTLAADGFVDATGDAALTFAAGFPCREPADGVIYGTQMMLLEGIDEARQPSRDALTARARAKAADYG